MCTPRRELSQVYGAQFGDPIGLLAEQKATGHVGHLAGHCAKSSAAPVKLEHAIGRVRVQGKLHR